MHDHPGPKAHSPPVKSCVKLAGRPSIAIAMDIGSHLMLSIQEGTAATVDDVLRAAINKRSKDVE
jgi:hypothetical protein